jgi:hypothetical protein
MLESAMVCGVVCSVLERVHSFFNIVFLIGS